ncbi:ABC transporter ATP-binding protein [Enterococcus nangangensis]
MIQLKNLQKIYEQTVALQDLDLTIRDGEIFGFLGHNGAGKSTTIKCLTSIIEPTTGEILFDNQPLAENRQAIKQRIGYVPDTPDLFLQLSANEYWQLIMAAYELKPAAVAERLQELTDLFDMTDHADETLNSFSHGMRQKVIVIGALLPDPDIWILDEPLQGLDPQAAFDLKELMKNHAKKGKTVIFSTHVLDTAQQLCDDLAILKHGQLLYNGSVADLLAEHPNESLETIYLKMAGRSAEDEQLMSQLTEEPHE